MADSWSFACVRVHHRRRLKNPANADVVKAIHSRHINELFSGLETAFIYVEEQV